MKIKTTKLDTVFSQFIRTRDNWTCRKCHKPYTQPTASLQCAHIMGRRNKGTRWLPENAVALCAGCHIHFTGQPIEFYDWLESEIGADALMKLRIFSKKPTKFTRADTDLIYADLKQKLILAKLRQKHANH